MNNLARKEDQNREITRVMSEVSRLSDPAILDEVAHKFIYSMPPERGLEVASLFSYANPFFLPNIPTEAAEQLAVNLEVLAEYVMRAKLTAARAPQSNILLACAPKSASTFIQDALRKGLNLPTASLFTATMDAGSGSALGANLREQEPDELAVLRVGLNGRGYVAQHHARCSPYMARMLSTYRIRPIITHRNILDTLVSMDDMVMQWRENMPAGMSGYFNDAMATRYHRLEREERLMALARRWAPWLVQFYVSWKKCEAMGLVQPLWVAYETDFLGDKSALAARVVDYLGVSGEAVGRLTAAFEDKSNADAKRLNKGVAGRGKDAPDAVREHVMTVAGFYREEADLTPLVGA